MKCVNEKFAFISKIILTSHPYAICHLKETCAFFNHIVLIGGSWWFLVVLGGSLLFLVVLCGFWCLLVLIGGS